MAAAVMSSRLLNLSIVITFSMQFLTTGSYI
jgi:hypothetical protein